MFTSRMFYQLEAGSAPINDLDPNFGLLLSGWHTLDSYGMFAVQPILISAKSMEGLSIVGLNPGTQNQSNSP